MLVLCSNGLSGKRLLHAVGEKMQACKNGVLVVTADNEYKESNYHVGRCRTELESLGLSVSTFDLDKQPAEELLVYDVVEFIGGNPFYLLHSIRTHRAEGVLRKLAEEKVLIGWSAAAFVFGPTLELINRYATELNFIGLTDLRGLSLSEIEVLPHYRKMRGRIKDFEETCREYEIAGKKKVFRINDGEGVIIDGEEAILYKEFFETCLAVGRVKQPICVIKELEHCIKKNGSFSFEEEELHVDVVKDAKQRMYLKVNERVCSAGGNGRPETRRSEYFYPFSGSLQEVTKENWKQYAILSERLYSLCEWS